MKAIKQISWDKVGQFSVIALAFFIPISTFLTGVFALSACVAWLCGTDMSKKRNILLHHPLVGWIYALILLSLLGMTYTIASRKSACDAMIDILRLGLIPILLYFYQPKKIARLALWAFAIAMIITLMLAFLKVYAGLPIGLKYTTGAIFKSHIKTSFFMAIAAFFLAVQMRKMVKWRLALGVVIALMIYYLFFMSVGRIGHFSILVCLLTLAWQWYRFKGLGWATLLASVLVFGAYFTSDVFSQRIDLLSQDLDFYYQGGRLLESSLGSRLQFAQTSLHLIAEKPILGWGTGSFGQAYASHYAGKETLLSDNPHNEYLRLGVELGLLGTILLMLLFYRQWRLAQKLNDDIRGFCQGILLTFILGCLLNSWLKDFTEGYFYCVMTSICFASIALPEKRLSLIRATYH